MIYFLLIIITAADSPLGQVYEYVHPKLDLEDELKYKMISSKFRQTNQVKITKYQIANKNFPFDFSQLGANMKRVVMRFCTLKEQFNLHLTSKPWREYFKYRNVCDSNDQIAITVLQEKQSGNYILAYSEKSRNRSFLLPLAMAFETKTWKWKYIFNVRLVGKYGLSERRNCGLAKLLWNKTDFAREFMKVAISQINPKERIKTCPQMHRLISLDADEIYVSPLRAIVLLNDVSLLSAWIQQKNDADNKDADGYTALMQVAFCCGVKWQQYANGKWHERDTCQMNYQREMCRLLLENGANVDASTNQDPGYTPLRFLMEPMEDAGTNLSGPNWNVEAMGDYFTAEIMQLLLTYGANPNIVRQSDGSTALAHATELGNLNLVKYHLVEALLTYGADPNLKSRGETCLSIAVEQESVDLCKILLKYDADATIENDDGTTALQLAQETYGNTYGNGRIIELLSRKRKRIE